MRDKSENEIEEDKGEGNLEIEVQGSVFSSGVVFQKKLATGVTQQRDNYI